MHQVTCGRLGQKNPNEVGVTIFFDFSFILSTLIFILDQSSLGPGEILVKSSFMIIYVTVFQDGDLNFLSVTGEGPDEKIGSRPPKHFNKFKLRA